MRGDSGSHQLETLVFAKNNLSNSHYIGVIRRAEAVDISNFQPVGMEAAILGPPCLSI
jgi:hypothetical protein